MANPGGNETAEAQRTQRNAGYKKGFGSKFNSKRNQYFVFQPGTGGMIIVKTNQK